MNSDEEDHTWEPSGRRSKRIKANSGKPLQVPTSNTQRTTPSLSLNLLRDIPDVPFELEDTIRNEDYPAVRLRYLRDVSEPDRYNNQIRPLTLAEIHDLREWFKSTAAAGRQNWTHGEAIWRRRLELRKHIKSKSAIFSYDPLQQSQQPRSPHHRPLRLPSPPPMHSAPDEQVLNSLYSIRKTPFSSSFASRLRATYGGHPHLIHRDWETQVPWMDLLFDIRLHYHLSHPDEERQDEIIAPIDYVPLQRTHLPQIHDMLTRIFWDGIDVSDSLQYSPAQCTVVATYKHLVVGAAFLSSPEETYLTYLVVRPGWENANIASVMLYHLIAANPKKDITLHVSTNNPAMLLYNKFGFKAEEFIVGFYEDYLPKESMACKNAFRLRLRR